MNILSIDTSTDICGVGLTTSGTGKVELTGEATLRLKNAHSEKLTGLIERLFEKTGSEPGMIDCIAVTIGPGSFTGLRIGLSVAKGLCFGWGKPLVAIPTLEAIARPFSTKYRTIWTAITSRQNEFYAACYVENVLVSEKRVFLLDEIKNIVKSGDFLITDDPDAFSGSPCTVSDKTAAEPTPLGIGQIAQKSALSKKFENPDSLVPDYWQGFRGKK